VETRKCAILGPSGGLSLPKKLYVQNLDGEIDSAILNDMFSCVGEVVNATVEVKSARGNNYRVGYVEMSTRQEALDGIDRFNGQKKFSNLLVVTEDRPHIPVITIPKKKSKQAKPVTRTKSPPVKVSSI
jgi:RNA recognition motif-containing protein